MKYFIGNNLIEYKEFQNTTLEECIKYCENQSILGLDIETTKKNKHLENKVYQCGLDPYLSSIVMLQIGDLNNQYIIDTRAINISPLKKILESPTILKVGHNLKFETKHLIVSNKIFLKNVYDTMICERVLYNGERLSYSLENLAFRYLNAEKVNNKPELFDVVEESEDYSEYNELDLIDNPYSFRIDKSIRLDFLNIKERPFYQQELNYALDDIIMPLLIREKQLEGRILNNETYLPLLGFKIENALVPILGKIELKGIKLDYKKWLDLYEKNLTKRKEIKDMLDKHVIKNYPKFTLLDLFNPDGICKIEWESSKQVIELFKHLKICPKAYSNQTNKVEYTVGAKELFKRLNVEYKEKFMKIMIPEKIESLQDLILTYLLYKKYQLYTTTFGKDFLKFIHPITKRVHTNLIQLKNTGRMASVSVNCQQIPNGKQWRECFIAEKGNKLLAVDYSQQEARIASEVHKEPLMQDFFINGSEIYADMHCFVASLVFSKMYNNPNLIITPNEKNERNKAKSITFKILFGGTAYTLAQDFSIEEEEAQKMIDSFLDSFPGLKQSFEDSKKEAVENGYVNICSLTEKKYFFPDFKLMQDMYKEFFSYFDDKYKSLSKEEKERFKSNLYEENPELKSIIRKAGKLKGKIERVSLNYPIQGSASTMIKLAMILIEKDNKDLKSGLLLPVHDELVLEYSESIIEEKNKEIKEILFKAGKQICENVPMDSVGEIGDYWVH